MGSFQPGVRAYRASLFCSALVAILTPTIDVVVGSEDQPSATKPATPPLLHRLKTPTTAARSHVFSDAHTALGPEPFFEDLTRPAETVAREGGEDVSTVEEPDRHLTYYVEVYENEARDVLYRRWRELTDSRLGRRFGSPGWNYKDGSAALPPSEIRPPDDWSWVSEWKIDGSGRRDSGGWEYSKELGKFHASRVPRGKKLTDRFRRRRWVRAMQPHRKQVTEEGSFETTTHTQTDGIGAPALHLHAYEYDPEDFGLELEEDLEDFLPAPDIYLRSTRDARPQSLPALAHAMTAFKGWWTEEFTFRGFGIGVVKPLFRGMLLRPDVGVGVRLPLTLHFRSWEKQEALPAVTASFFVLWPPAVQVSQAVSYPAELLQEWATTVVRKVASPSKDALQARQRKEAVQRLGISVGVRYSATYGFQWWLAPYFFLLPGVRVVWHLYESMMAILSRMALMQRSDGAHNVTDKDAREEIIWLMALRYWAAAKTSGLGYSLNYAGSRLGGAVLVNFQPFFLPTFSSRQSTKSDDSPTGEHVVSHDMLDMTTATTTADERAEDVSEIIPLESKNEGTLPKPTMSTEIVRQIVTA